MKIVAQLTLANDPALNQMTAGVTAEVLEQVCRAFPRWIRSGWACAGTSPGRTLIQMLSQIDLWTPHKRGDDPGALRRVTADLVDFVAGGVEAIRAEAQPRAQAPRGLTATGGSDSPAATASPGTV